MPVNPHQNSCSFELPPQLVEALLPLAQQVSSAKGEEIFRQGSPCRGAFILRQGSSRLSILADSGAEVFSRTLGSGCILGLAATLCGHPYENTAIAMEDSDLAWIDAPTLQEFVRARPDLSIAIVQVMSRELADMHARRANFASCKACGCALADTCSHHLILP